jgi:carbon monoxide dehydrogenase subunit G
MKYKKCAVTFLAAFLLLVGSLHPVQAGKGDEKKLGKGEILFTMETPSKDSLPVFQTRGVVDCPPAEVWKVINDYDNLAAIMPGIVEGRVEKVEGNVVYFYEKDHVPVVEDTWYLLRCVHDDDNFRKTMSMVDGSVKSLEAEWALKPFGEGKTLVQYTLQSDPGFYVPKWVQKMSLKHTTTGFFEALRKNACTGND